MRKKLNIAGVQNELSGGSAFFPNYSNQQASDHAAAPRSVTPVPTPSADAPVRPVRDVRPGLPVRDQKKRYMRRHPFEIYDDQYQDLRDLALQERMQGGVGSMSAMVREALDTFIEKRRKK